MDINQLIAIIKKKLNDQFIIKEIVIEDKTYLHKNHKSFIKGKFHLKIKISSNELKKLDKIKSNKIIYKTLDHEIKNYIHSIQILIS